MMFAERWLSRAMPATSATPATQHEKANKSAYIEVAEALLPECYLTPSEAPGSRKEAVGSKGAATQFSAEAGHFSSQVAGVAEVADRRLRQSQHDDRWASENSWSHQSKVATSTPLPRSFADLRDLFEEGRAVAERDGGLSRSKAERQAFNDTIWLVSGLDHETINRANAWFDCGCPPEWALGVLWLQTMPAPLAFPDQRWERVQKDAITFACPWAMQAADASWSATELFGLSRKSPWYNWRAFGVVPMLNSHSIIAVDPEMMTISTKSGAILCYRRRSVWYDAVPAWEIGA